MPGPSHWRVGSSRSCWRIAGAPLGGETLLRDGRPVGDLTSAGYGHTIGASVGLGYVMREDGQSIDAAWLRRQVRGRSGRPAAQGQGRLKAPYDPAGARIKG